MSQRVPPHSIESEQSVLGIMMLSQDAVAIAISQVSPEDFYKPAHQKIMEACVGLFGKAEPVNVISVSSWLNGHGGVGAAGGAAYLSSLLDVIPMASSVSGFCKIISDNSRARSMIELAGQAMADCYVKPINEVMNNFGDKFFRVAAESGKTSSPISAVIGDTVQRISSIQRNGQHPGVSTGYMDLDERLGGMQPSDLHILAARPSMGKTALAMNIAENAAETGAKVMIFSLEMGSWQLGGRMLSCRSEVDGDLMRKGRLNGDQWKMVNSAAGQLSSLPIVIDESSGISITELVAKAKVEHIRGDVGLIVVDYLQLLHAKAQSREQEISMISRNLKELAKALKCPVLALSQLNRSLENRTDKRPQLSDLRESGAIEQDADVVMFIYRDEVYNKAPDNPERGMAEIITAKQRNGPVGTDRLLFEGQYSKFRSYHCAR